MSDLSTVVIIGFHTTYEKTHATGNMDRPIDWVTYAPIHAANSTRIVAPVKSIMPPQNMARDKGGLKMNLMRHRWEQIEPAYKAWKDGHELPVNGTPLGAWPGINAVQANAFIAKGLNSVEQIASMPDTVIEKIHLPNVRGLVEQARAFVAAHDRNSVANRITEMEKSNADLQEQLAAAMALLEEQTKPKRLRPRKEDAEQEAEAA